MRRLFACLSALCLLGSLGCHKHVAGVCDCDIPGHNCLPCCAWHHMAPGVHIPASGKPAAEPAKEVKPGDTGSW